VVTYVAGDHVAKSQETTGVNNGGSHCSLLSDSIKWLFEQPSGFEHEVLNPFRVLEGDRNTARCVRRPCPGFLSRCRVSPRRALGKGRRCSKLR